MSEKEIIVLEYIKHFWTRFKQSPSIREICFGTGVSSTSTVVYYLDKLEYLGEIERRPGSRGIIPKGMHVVFDEVAP